MSYAIIPYRLPAGALEDILANGDANVIKKITARYRVECKNHNNHFQDEIEDDGHPTLEEATSLLIAGQQRQAPAYVYGYCNELICKHVGEVMHPCNELSSFSFDFMDDVDARLAELGLPAPLRLDLLISNAPPWLREPDDFPAMGWYESDFLKANLPLIIEARAKAKDDDLKLILANMQEWFESEELMLYCY